MGLDVLGTMTRVARHLNVPKAAIARITTADLGATGLKKSHEDLTQKVSNFADLERALQSGPFASSCLLRMLRSRVPEVFPECPVVAEAVRRAYAMQRSNGCNTSADDPSHLLDCLGRRCNAYG